MTTNNNFDSKEHYLAFRKAWSSAITAKEAKSYLVPPTQFTSDGKPIKVTGRERHKGWIDSTHIMLFNVLTGRDLLKGFTNKLNGDNTTVVNAAWKLSFAISQAKKYVADAPNDFKIAAQLLNKPVVIANMNWHLERLLRPFNGTVTPSDLAKLDGDVLYKQVKETQV
jgi:hypothetical protein